jgi:hypothetical protein
MMAHLQFPMELMEIGLGHLVHDQAIATISLIQDTARRH